VTKSQHFKTIDLLQEALEEFWCKHFFTQKFYALLMSLTKMYVEKSGDEKL